MLLRPRNQEPISGLYWTTRNDHSEGIAGLVDNEK